MGLNHKILIYLALWKRPEITEICFMGIRRLRREFGVEAFAVLSEESMIPLCEKYGVMWCFHENQPLGEKKNFGLQRALDELDWDYIIEIGSDDVLKNEIFEIYEPLLGKRDLLTIGDIIMMNSEDKACRRVNTASNYGVGRAISRAAIEKMGGELWASAANQNMDGNSIFRMARQGILEMRVKSDRPLAIDIKSKTNIWAFNYLLGSEYDFETALEGLDECEKEAIRALC